MISVKVFKICFQNTSKCVSVFLLVVRGRDGGALRPDGSFHGFEFAISKCC